MFKEIKGFQVYQLSIEDLSQIVREAVATELQKINSIIQLNPKDDSDKILTRNEVCKLLNVSLVTLYHWNNNKILVNSKVGGRVYYMKSDVMNKLNNVA
jgi:hypothetical protein